MTPSTPAPTDSGALADRIDQCAAIMLVGSDGIKGYLPVGSPKVISAALRNSAPQETRGDFDAVIDSVSNATAIIEQETRGDERLIELKRLASLAFPYREGSWYFENNETRDRFTDLAVSYFEALAAPPAIATAGEGGD